MDPADTPSAVCVVFVDNQSFATGARFCNAMLCFAADTAIIERISSDTFGSDGGRPRF